jgi:hypothetical protein
MKTSLKPEEFVDIGMKLTDAQIAIDDATECLVNGSDSSLKWQIDALYDVVVKLKEITDGQY